MQVRRVVKAGLTRPFGDERTVNQAFPAGVPSEESDPFLMCDYLAIPSPGLAEDPDHFDVGWHPHRGMDILTYLKSGVGRHGDSMGNRETFATPGMQWISCGSGIEHAEGGATPAGEIMEGLQIWINVPAARKMDPPSYGTEPPEALPLEAVAPGATARLLAGPMGDGDVGRVGPMRAQCRVQVVDFELDPGARVSHCVPPDMDTCLLYVYGGGGEIGGRRVTVGSVAVLDAALSGETEERARVFTFVGDAAEGAKFMLFAGKKLREPVAWHGPIVMNTQEQIQECFRELQSGRFPPTRVPWDYKRIASKPS